MNNWWFSLSIVQKIFWGTAIFSSIIFSIQMLLTLFGLHHDTDMDTGSDFDSFDHANSHFDHSDTDFDDSGGHDSHDQDADHDSDSHDGLQRTLVSYFTVRNMVAFFLGFSWGGLTYIDNGLSIPLSIFLAVLTGLVFSGVVMLLMKVLASMRSDGTLSLENAIGAEAVVSIFISPEMGGAGKVILSVQGRSMDLDAITKGGELRRGQRVKVVGLIGSRLLVEKS